MELPFTAPEPYILVLTGAGFLIALVAWLPLALRKIPLSLPIVCIALGAAIFLLPGIALHPSPLVHPLVTERFSEFVVIIALMGAGLKLDRPFSLRRWSVTWRLIGITMPLGIAVLTYLGTVLLDLSIAVALLLAASLAPTDPVLAADVQVGPPRPARKTRCASG
jgi:sodium/hydrogen antiporter